MDTNKVIIVVMAAILIIAAVIIGFVAFDTRTEQIHPVGPMIGDKQLQPAPLIIKEINVKRIGSNVTDWTSRT